MSKTAYKKEAERVVHKHVAANLKAQECLRLALENLDRAAHRPGGADARQERKAVGRAVRAAIAVLTEALPRVP